MTATQFPVPIGERPTVRARLKCNLGLPRAFPNQECCLADISFCLSFFGLTIVCAHGFSRYPLMKNKISRTSHRQSGHLLYLLHTHAHTH